MATSPEPMVGTNQYDYITPAFARSPWWGAPSLSRWQHIWPSQAPMNSARVNHLHTGKNVSTVERPVYQMRSIGSNKINSNGPTRVMDSLPESPNVHLHDWRVAGRWSGLGICTASSRATLIQGLPGLQPGQHHGVHRTV